MFHVLQNNSKSSYTNRYQSSFPSSPQLPALALRHSRHFAEDLLRSEPATFRTVDLAMLLANSLTKALLSLVHMWVLSCLPVIFCPSWALGMCQSSSHCLLFKSIFIASLWPCQSHYPVLLDKNMRHWEHHDSIHSSEKLGCNTISQMSLCWLGVILQDSLFCPAPLMSFQPPERMLSREAALEPLKPAQSPGCSIKMNSLL